MKINNSEVIIPDLQTENIDGELVVYNQTSKTIVVFNKTASLVWEMIQKHKESCTDVSTENIVEKVMEIYKIPVSERDCIFTDIHDIIKRFFTVRLIITDFEV